MKIKYKMEITIKEISFIGNSDYSTVFVIKCHNENHQKFKYAAKVINNSSDET